VKAPPRGEIAFDLEGVISRLVTTGVRPGKKAATGAAAPLVSARPAPAPPRGNGQARRTDGYAAFRQAHAAARAGELGRAIELYTEAIDSGTLTLAHRADAYFNRANALHADGRYDDAIADYDAAIRSDPNFAGAYYNRGFSYQAKGERERAIADFRMARDLGLQRLGVRFPDRPPPLP